jgi:hypothetical protein
MKSSLRPINTGASSYFFDSKIESPVRFQEPLRTQAYGFALLS